MEITLEGLGKRFMRKWVFKDLSATIKTGQRVGVTGHNGSGKSTLLRVITGAMPASEGAVKYSIDQHSIHIDKVYQHFDFAAPYSDLIEELTIGEAVRFHRRFRTFREDLQTKDVLEILGPQFRSNSFIKSLSSGMKQRVRLVFAVLTESDVLLLDEPTSNLDEESRAWYQNLIQRVPASTTLLIASNEADDMKICESFLRVPDYAPSK